MVAAADGPEGEQPDQPGTPPPPSVPDFANETTVLHPMERPDGSGDQPGFAPPSPAEQAQMTPSPFDKLPPPGPSGFPPPAPGAPPAYAQQPPGYPQQPPPPGGQPGWGAPPPPGPGFPPPSGSYPPDAGGPPPFGAPPPPGGGFTPPPYGGPPTGPGPGGPERKKKKGGLIFLIVAVVVVLGLIAGAVVVLGGDDDDDDVEAIDASELVLLAANDAGSNAFANGLTPAFGTLSDGAKNARPEGGHSYFGTLDQVHGGFFERSECHRDDIAAALADDDDRAEAFAERLGADDVDAALADLTPVVLLNDTRVTDYGFSDGEVVARQAVLQEGTAVMVDDRGVPRVRCASGNPLGEPGDIEGDPTLTGEPWSTFVEDKVVTIDPGEEPVELFVLTDVESGEVFTRPVGSEGDDDEPVVVEEPTTTTVEETTTTTATVPETTTTTVPETTTTVLGTGDVQVTLRWDGPADMDIYVTDPNGEQLSFGSRSTSSGGQLDVDANAACVEASGAPTENVFWPPGAAPLGTYIVGVSLYDLCGSGAPVAWTLTITVDGQIWVLSGATAEAQVPVVADATIVRGEGGGVTPGAGVTVTTDPTTTTPGGPTTTTG
jgi:hypothetical protein